MPDDNIYEAIGPLWRVVKAMKEFERDKITENKHNPVHDIYGIIVYIR